MNLNQIIARLRPDHIVLLGGFSKSPEYGALPPQPQELTWSAAFLETMQSCDLGWTEIDIYILRGLLYGAMSWLIDASPEDPPAVARELAALIRYAARVDEVGDAPGCLAYLLSDRAGSDIAAWVAPVKEDRTPVAEAG